jgi:hypothetical protein
MEKYKGDVHVSVCSRTQLIVYGRPPFHLASEALNIHSSALFVQREFSESAQDIPVYRVLKNARSAHNLEE